ncbi:E3 ubiquitin-protein ligase RNF8 [Ornithorhynchus anatinus]|uniref:E3 ubiquitin-protein ligase RNF8 n=1 Tax=Ornithorhynchus anatinus TaxID=9258 RepID=F7DBM1_ORNAN|nr:E3 ubiquitin-protein ligase RNF8 [Ornithorhynchus anatinus]
MEEPRRARPWCLRRVGMSSDWLLLDNLTEVTLGRGFGVTYRLVSKTCPLMISRNHCILRQNAEGLWTVMDNKSLNGVWLNKERIEPLRAYPIQEGDYIQLGVPLENKENAEYEYEMIREDWEKIRLSVALRSDQLAGKGKGPRAKRKLEGEAADAPGAEGPSGPKSKVCRLSCGGEFPGRSRESEPGARRPARHPDADPSSPPGPSPGKDPGTLRGLDGGKWEAPGTEGPSSPKSRLCILLSDLEPPGRHWEREPPADRPAHEPGASPGPSREPAAGACDSLRRKTAAPSPRGPDASARSGLDLLRKNMAEILRLKVKVQEKQAAVLTLKQQKKGAQKAVVKMEQELRELEEQLCTEQAQQRQRAEQLEKKFQEEKRDSEGPAGRPGEDNLTEQLAQALKEHQVLMEELSRSKSDFEAIIQAKNKELEQTKEEKEMVQAQKEEALNHFSDVLENELQCTICSDYFIEAVTLNCAHSFCSFCISEWMKRKEECPICRQLIQSKSRSLVLDNTIGRMVESLSAEVKERWAAHVKERREKITPAEN